LARKNSGGAVALRGEALFFLDFFFVSFLLHQGKRNENQKRIRISNRELKAEALRSSKAKFIIL